MSAESQNSTKEQFLNMSTAISNMILHEKLMKYLAYYTITFITN